MHILVTGGAGFIGGHLAESFVEADHDVTTLDILEPFYDLGLKGHNIDAARQLWVLGRLVQHWRVDRNTRSVVPRGDRDA